MNIAWQDAVTLGLVAAAVICLIRRLCRIGRQRAGCGTCQDCEQPSKPTQLISLEPPKDDP